MEKKTKEMKEGKKEKKKGKKLKKRKNKEEKITFGHLRAEGQAVRWHRHAASTESCRCWLSGVRHQKEEEGNSGASWKLFLKGEKKKKK